MAIKFLNSVAVDTDVLFVDTANERVGIGTETPLSTLSIKGGTEALRFERDSQETYRVLHGTSGLYFSHPNSGALLLGLTQNGDITVSNDQSAEYVRFDNSSSNVGIGTTSPAYKLDVNGIIRSENSSEIGTLYLGNTAQSQIPGGAIIGQRSSYSSTGKMEFQVPTWGANTDYGLTTQMTIEVSTSDTKEATISMIPFGGKVGIGTTSPSSILELAGATPILTLNSTAVNVAQGIEWRSSGTLDAYIKQGPSTAEFEFNVGRNTTWGGDFKFVTDTYDAYRITKNQHKFFILGSEKMRIASSGNVGIGTTSPGYPLEVSGIIKTSTSFLGTTAIIQKVTALNANGIQFTNNGGSEKMRITDSGNVGIGTTSPSRPLSVYRSTAGSVANFLHYTDATAFAGLYINVDNANNIVEFNASGDTASTMAFQTGNAERMRITSAGNVGIGTTSPNVAFKLDVIGNTSTSGNLYIGNADDLVTPTTILALNSGRVRGVTLANLINASGGPYLPLAGGTMTGATLHGDSVHSYWGASNDLQIDHDGNHSVINNLTGHIYISNESDDGDIVFRSDDGSGGVTEYVRLDGGIKRTIFSQNAGFEDNTRVIFGSGNDLQIYHDGSNSYISDTGTGDLIITADNDLTFKDGSGNIMANMNASNSVELMFGNSKKFETTSAGVTVTGDTTADQFISNNNGNGQNYKIGDDVWIGDINVANTFRVQGASNPNNGYITFGNASNTQLGRAASGPLTWGGAFEATTSVTSPTFLGDLNGTINTVTTAVTKANATNDTTVATTAFVQNLIGTIPAGLVFQGTWNAATNTPTLTSGSGTTGHFYIVSTSGSTNLDGVTDWVTGDWAVFIEQGGTDAWEKIDNSSVLDGAGTGQTVALWSGSGTSNTLTDAPITVSGNNTTFAGQININSGNDLRLYRSDNATYARFNYAGGSVGLDIDDLNGDGINLQQAGVNKLRIETSGNATFAGNVALSGQASPQLFLTSNTAGTPNYTLIANASSQFIIGRAGVSNDFILDSGNATFAGDVSLGGNLTLTTNARYLRAEDSAGTTTRLLGINSANITYIGPIDAYSGGDIFYGVSAGVSNQVFYTGASERMRITSAGNIGIGTTSPQEILHLSQTAHSDEVQILVENTGYLAGAKSSISLSTKGTSGTAVLSRISNQQEGSSAGTLVFDTNSSERMRITSAGDTGIGVTTPRAKLDVAGGIKVADDTDTAGANKVGTLRYRTSGNNSYVDMCMQTGASTYAWINVVQNNW